MITIKELVNPCPKCESCEACDKEVGFVIIKFGAYSVTLGKQCYTEFRRTLAVQGPDIPPGNAARYPSDGSSRGNMVDY